MEHYYCSVLIIFILSLAPTKFVDCQLQCKNPEGRSVDWFTAIKLPTITSGVSDGTTYLYMDAVNSKWKYLTGITTEESAIGHTVSQMYAPTKSYNNSIMWMVYNDETTNGKVSSTKGHSKGVIIADGTSGLWLVHSVPKFPQLPYQSNLYMYPKTAIRYGQSFLCISMSAEELDKVGNQLITNEVQVYGGHFGNNLKEKYSGLYNATLKRGRATTDNYGVRMQRLRSINGFKFLSISKNKNFKKDLYEDIITNMAQSNVYAETWLNTRHRFPSFCSGKYKAMNIKTLEMKGIEGLKTVSFNSTKDHSKWVITENSALPWICIGDINRSLEQTHRGGGTVCLDSIQIWNQYKKLISDIESCKK